METATIDAPLLAPSAEDLEGAMRILLDAVMRHRRHQAFKKDKAPARIELIDSGALMAANPDALHARSLVDDPIGGALRKQFKVVGQLLFDQLGSTGALEKVVDRLCQRGPSGWSRRMSFVDHALDGVGTDGDRWWA